MKVLLPAIAVACSLAAMLEAAEPREPLKAAPANTAPVQVATAVQTMPTPYTAVNPSIDANGFLDLSVKAAKHRETRRVSEADFIRMSQEKDTIILDARSKEMYDLLHVKGAINLSFPNIAFESIQKTIPDKNTRILIYCNNNFQTTTPVAKIAFMTKGGALSLNVPTFITLYGYGYHNVYELGPLVDPQDTKLELVPTSNSK